MVANSGALKPIVVASASGSIRKVWNTISMEVMPISPRVRCASGRRVRTARMPGTAMIQPAMIGKENKLR
jgi:hypothetical protein